MPLLLYIRVIPKNLFPNSMSIPSDTTDKYL
jgi:hypothetical protein